MAPHGASGRGTCLLDDGTNRRLRTRDPVCSQSAACMDAMPSKVDGFMIAGIPVVGGQNMVVAFDARLRCDNSLGEFHHRPQRCRNICRAVFFFASIPIKTETIPCLCAVPSEHFEMVLLRLHRIKTTTLVLAPVPARALV